MSHNEQGRESIESIDQTWDADQQNPETTTHWEVAGGDGADVPGGAYNVPSGLKSATRRRCAIRRMPTLNEGEGDPAHV